MLGREGRRVLTSSGVFEGNILVDATGPRAALAGPGRPRHVAFGLESEVPVQIEPCLHFHFAPEIPDGYAWAFPCGQAARFGVLSYRGRTKLRPALERFMARFGLRPDGLHGGHLATGWTPGTTDNVFAAGDAAGHCLPLSGEGIRTAVLAGAGCGALIQQVLDGEISLVEAQAAYRSFVAADRMRYRALLGGNILLLGLPRFLGRSGHRSGRQGGLEWGGRDRASHVPPGWKCLRVDVEADDSRVALPPTAAELKAAGLACYHPCACGRLQSVCACRGGGTGHTRRTQNPLGETPCGFDSRPRHHQ